MYARNISYYQETHIASYHAEKYVLREPHGNNIASARLSEGGSIYYL